MIEFPLLKKKVGCGLEASGRSIRFKHVFEHADFSAEPVYFIDEIPHVPAGLNSWEVAGVKLVVDPGVGWFVGADDVQSAADGFDS
jgi:hypothetical protein